MAITKLAQRDIASTTDHFIERSSEVTVAMNGFFETSKMVLDGLAALGNIHPVISGAVPFH